MSELKNIWNFVSEYLVTFSLAISAFIFGIIAVYTWIHPLVVSIVNLIISIPCVYITHRKRERDKEKERQKEKASQVSMIVMGRMNKFWETFGTSSNKSIHWINMPQEWRWKPSDLWGKYHISVCSTFERDFSDIKKGIDNANRSLDLTEIIRCFIALTSLGRRYHDFIEYFYDQHKNESLPEAVQRWYDNCVKEYNKLGDLFGEDTKNIEAILGTGTLSIVENRPIEKTFGQVMTFKQGQAER